MPDYLLVGMPPKMSISSSKGYLKGKNTMMVFEISKKYRNLGKRNTEPNKGFVIYYIEHTDFFKGSRDQTAMD